MKKNAAVFLLLILALAGCNSNPTNEASNDSINDAVDRKLKAIDEDQTLTPEGKAMLKSKIGGYVGDKAGQNSSGKAGR